VIDLLLSGRILLALVFVVAGVAKLFDQTGSRRATQDFGIPPRLAPITAVILPFAELSVAAALLPVTTAWWGAVGALVLLLVFMAGVAMSLAQGRHPDCHCFGQLHSAPASWGMLARNGALAGVAWLIVWFGRSGAGPSALSWLWIWPPLLVAEILAGIILLTLAAVQVWLLVHVLKQQGRLLVRIEALEASRASHHHSSDQLDPSRGGRRGPRPVLGFPSRPAADFALPNTDGVLRSLSDLRRAGKPVLLVFTDPGCGSCKALMPEVAAWRRDYVGQFTVACISRGGVRENGNEADQYGLGEILLQRDREVAERYGVNGTPSAVLVTVDGYLGSPPAAGAHAVRELVVWATTPSKSRAQHPPDRQVASPTYELENVR
jgi:peroxiredoxin/uncharacterized membrane protein YphA (DoxX/SURF4 family)